jgi:thiamine monophosphate kinase
VKPLTYRQAGVDIDAGDDAVRRITPLARATNRAEVIGGVGGFASLVGLPSKYREPVMVSSTDGVGSKLKIACLAGRHDTVGIDLVAMGVNDILVPGAEPLYFLDYISVGRLDPGQIEAIVGGIAEGCRQAGLRLVGGEMAEHPDSLPPGEYDLAGFAVGIAERQRLIDGSKIRPGDVVPGPGLVGSALQRLQPGTAHRVRRDEAPRDRYPAGNRTTRGGRAAHSDAHLRPIDSDPTGNGRGEGHGARDRGRRSPATSPACSLTVAEPG